MAAEGKHHGLLSTRSSHSGFATQTAAMMLKSDVDEQAVLPTQLEVDSTRRVPVL